MRTRNAFSSFVLACSFGWLVVTSPSACAELNMDQKVKILLAKAKTMTAKARNVEVLANSRDEATLQGAMSGIEQCDETFEELEALLAE